MISVIRLSEISRFRKTRARELWVYDFQNKRQPHHRKPSYSLRPCRFPAGISHKKLELSSNSCKLWRHFILTSNDHARWLCLPLSNVNINFFSQAMRLWKIVRNFSAWVTLDKNILTIAWIFQLQWYYNVHEFTYTQKYNWMPSVVSGYWLLKIYEVFSFFTISIVLSILPHTRKKNHKFIFPSWDEIRFFHISNWNVCALGSLPLKHLI